MPSLLAKQVAAATAALGLAGIGFALAVAPPVKSAVPTEYGNVVEKGPVVVFSPATMVTTATLLISPPIAQTR